MKLTLNSELFSKKSLLFDFFYPKKNGGDLIFFVGCVYFLRSSKIATTAIAAIIAIDDPAMYVSVIGAGVASG